MDTALGKFHCLYNKLTNVGVRKADVGVLNESTEPNFSQMSVYFAECHHMWLRVEQELASRKEIITKTEIENETLKVKLKQAQNQLDVEIRRRQQAEAYCEKLDRQIQLIRELPFSEGSSSIQLSAEQRSALAFFNNNNQTASNLNPSCKLQTKDESASVLSDISYDKANDSLDCNASTVRTDRLRKRKKCVRFSKSAKPEEKQPSLPEGEMKTPPSTPENNGGVRLHEFVSKTGVLSDYVPETSPMIPSLVVYCISQIEQRGLHVPGLYSVPGVDSRVKELKEKFHRSKTVPVLSKKDDIHAITGLLKNFLRNLEEPLLTDRLRQSFMDLAVSEDSNSIALMYQTIGDLPQPNRVTLAYLMLHLQRVANSEETRMGIKNLALIFGPTLLGHAVQTPEPMILFKDTTRQFKVVARLLSLPCDYWAQFVMTENGQPNLPTTDRERELLCHS